MKNQNSLVALLPMKANSERVKGKNFRYFCGKPLYRWVLDTLLNCERIDLIVINTDAKGILLKNSFPVSNRILIRNRPKVLFSDFVSINKIIENDLQNINAKTFLMTHITNPFLSLETIKNALLVFDNAKSKQSNDSLFYVNSFQTRFYRKDGKPVNYDPSNLIRTQDIETWYEENSNLYLFSKENFQKSNNRIGYSSVLFETLKYESFDIDTEEDWKYAEMIMKLKQNNNQIK